MTTKVIKLPLISVELTTTEKYLEMVFFTDGKKRDEIYYYDYDHIYDFSLDITSKYGKEASDVMIKFVYSSPEYKASIRSAGKPISKDSLDKSSPQL
jgi:hypothetical protein